MAEIQDANYLNVHQWLHRHHGKASCCENPTCPKINTFYQWAKRKGYAYERKRENFMQMCISCHGRYDRNVLDRTECIRGHSLQGENVYIDKKSGLARCRTCRRDLERIRKNRVEPTPGFCQNGHELAAVGTRSYPSNPKKELCRMCERNRYDRKNAKNRERKSPDVHPYKPKEEQ